MCHRLCSDDGYARLTNRECLVIVSWKFTCESAKSMGTSEQIQDLLADMRAKPTEVCGDTHLQVTGKYKASELTSLMDVPIPFNKSYNSVTACTCIDQIQHTVCSGVDTQRCR